MEHSDPTPNVVQKTRPCSYCGYPVPDSGVFGLPTYTDIPTNHALDCPIREIMEVRNAQREQPATCPVCGARLQYDASGFRYFRCGLIYSEITGDSIAECTRAPRVALRLQAQNRALLKQVAHLQARVEVAERAAAAGLDAARTCWTAWLNERAARLGIGVPPDLPAFNWGQLKPPAPAATTAEPEPPEPIETYTTAEVEEWDRYARSLS